VRGLVEIASGGEKGLDIRAVRASTVHPLTMVGRVFVSEPRTWLLQGKCSRLTEIRVLHRLVSHTKALMKDEGNSHLFQSSSRETRASEILT
jgi:hypothetical protein